MAIEILTQNDTINSDILSVRTKLSEHPGNARLSEYICAVIKRAYASGCLDGFEMAIIDNENKA